MSIIVARVKFTQWKARLVNGRQLPAGITGEVAVDGFPRLTAASTVRLAKELAAAGELVKFQPNSKTPDGIAAEVGSRGTLVLNIDDAVHGAIEVTGWKTNRVSEEQVAELGGLFGQLGTTPAAPAPITPASAPDLAV